MLTYESWEQVKQQAQNSINQAQIGLIVNTLILHAAEKEIKKFPKHALEETKEESKGVK